MTKYTPFMVIIVVFASIVAFGCQEPLVGAPCVPETDDGEFSTTLSGKTFSIETRSVQCETGVCITATQPIAGQNPDPSQDTLVEEYRYTQKKHSFCSCRCMTGDGQTYDRQDDKLDDLCECPGSTICAEVLPSTVDVAENVAGSYCIPDCVLNGCPIDPNPEVLSTEMICVPSSNDEEPWKWRCVSCLDTPADDCPNNDG